MEKYNTTVSGRCLLLSRKKHLLSPETKKISALFDSDSNQKDVDRLFNVVILLWPRKQEFISFFSAWKVKL